MTTRRTEYALNIQNGKALYLPPWEAGNDKWGNLELPSVYLSSTKQEYPTGTIYRHGMRTFVYTLTDATYFGQKGTGDGSINMGYLCESCAEFDVILNGVISGAAGATTVRVTRASTAVNAYAGGFIGIKMGTGNRQTAGRTSAYQIISNTVQDSSDIVTFTLDGALVIALTTADDVVLTEHPYYKARSPFSGPYGMAIGVWMQQTYASRYCWVQTGGPINFISILSTYEGAEAGGCIPVYAMGGNAQTTLDKAQSILMTGYEASAYQLIGDTYASTNIGGAEGTPANVSIAPAVFLKIFN